MQTSSSLHLGWHWNALLFLPPLLLFAILQFGFGFSGFYGQDSHAYLEYSQRIAGALHGGPLPGSFFWPANYPFLGALFSLLGSSPLLGLPIISTVSYFALLVLFRNCVQTFYQTTTASASLFTLGTLGISPVMIRAAGIAMSDMLAITLVFAAFAFGHRFTQQSQLRTLLLASLAAGMALGTRYAVVPLLLPFSMALLWVVLKKRAYFWAILTGAALLLGLLPTWWATGNIWGWQPPTQVHTFSVLNLFRSDFPHHLDGHLSYPHSNIVFFLSPFYRPDYCLLLPFLLLLSGPGDFRSNTLKLSIATAVFYLLFLAGLQVQNPRFILPALPFLLLPTYPSWKRLWACVPNRGLKAAMVAFWMCACSFLAVRLLQPMVFQDHLEKQVAQTLKTLPPGPLYTFAMDVALPTHGVERPIISLWGQTLTQFETPGYALFNVTLFSKQWAQQAPMLNWEKLNQSMHLVELQTFPQGWQLFRIAERDEKHPSNPRFDSPQ